MFISFVIPTRHRHDELAYTLGQLEMLDLEDLGGRCELIVVDNGSDSPMDLAGSLANGIEVRQVNLNENRGAGARNIGAEHARGEWVIMLDDDSNLCPGDIGGFLAQVQEGISAIGGEIYLPDGSHEAGGLPEVVVGCGCAFRRDVFLDVGGYDSSFGYYAEEYDLCAKMIAAGYRVEHTRAIRFEHRKSSVGRDMDQILYRLVRNNGWVIRRYAPEVLVECMLDTMKKRYEQIALKVGAIRGFEKGLLELSQTIEEQTRSPLCANRWDRFVGVEALRGGLGACLLERSPEHISIVGPAQGKGLEYIRSEIESLGIKIDASAGQGVEVIGTLSPGPMLDAQRAFPRAVSPWYLSDSLQMGVQQ